MQEEKLSQIFGKFTNKPVAMINERPASFGVNRPSRFMTADPDPKDVNIKELKKLAKKNNLSVSFYVEQAPIGDQRIVTRDPYAWMDRSRPTRDDAICVSIEKDEGKQRKWRISGVKFATV